MSLGFPPSAIMKNVYNLTTNGVLFIENDTIPNDLLNQYLVYLKWNLYSFNVTSGPKPDMTAYSDEASINQYVVNQNGPTSYSINS